MNLVNDCFNLREVYDEVMEISEKMNLPEEIRKSIRISINLNISAVKASVALNKKDRKIDLEIPMLFLLKKSDLSGNPIIKKYFDEVRNANKFSIEGLRFIFAFLEFLEDEDLAKKARTFVLHHELAHICHQDILSAPCSNKESRKREKRADLTAAKYLGETAGAVYCFQIMGKWLPQFEQKGSHPPVSKRIQYLQATD